MIFFKPSARYAKWLATYANGRMIVDIGCGEGALIRAVRKAGYNKIIGFDLQFDPLDPSNKDLTNAVMPSDALESSLLAGKQKSPPMLCVLARPCHGGWPVMMAKLVTPHSELIYIGLECNHEQDWEESGFHLVPLADAPIGPEDEVTSVVKAGDKTESDPFHDFGRRTYGSKQAILRDVESRAY